MKKLKIKLEYTFFVPEDTNIVEDEWDGLFISNERYGIKSLPCVKGLKIDYQKIDDKGELAHTSLSYDDGKMEDFLYNSKDVFMDLEKTTITLGKEKFQHIL